MEVNVEIVLSYNDEETDWKVKKNISRFIYRLKKYRTGNRFSGEYTYKINQDSELYKQIIEFYKSNRKDVEFICLDYDVKVSDEEFEKAKAFVLCFPEYYCEEYEDIENEYSECESCHSKEKTNSLFYAQPKGYIKKHENDYGFAGLDGTGELLLLPKLVEKLKESGVDKKYFQPIISKSKKILGYTFITDNILPQKSYIDENYKFENQCEKCGRINMTENENIFHFIPKRITEEGIKNLKDVNKTYEFYDEYREIIISKKVAQIIKENVPQRVRRDGHPARKSFQALRIAVNDELGVLERGLDGAFELLGSGGRLAVITFHSLEDRIVKQKMASWCQGCTCPKDFPVCVCGNKPKAKLVVRKPVCANETELRNNPRARSAKLRICEKI